jgi:hypothetical protein
LLGVFALIIQPPQSGHTTPAVVGGVFFVQNSCEEPHNNITPHPSQ